MSWSVAIKDNVLMLCVPWNSPASMDDVIAYSELLDMFSLLLVHQICAAGLALSVLQVRFTLLPCATWEEGKAVFMVMRLIKTVKK